MRNSANECEPYTDQQGDMDLDHEQLEYLTTDESVVSWDGVECLNNNI